jgi:hypothetical protein
MSTRCQVAVIEQGKNLIITLYHHTDGYPEFIIPKIFEAYSWEGDEWVKTKAGKVTSLLCWSDPGVFEPENSHMLHLDITYYYRLYCGELMDDHANWDVEIYKKKSLTEDQMYALLKVDILDQIKRYQTESIDNILREDFDLIGQRQNIQDIIKTY